MLTTDPSPVTFTPRERAILVRGCVLISTEDSAKLFSALLGMITSDNPAQAEAFLDLLEEFCADT